MHGMNYLLEFEAVFPEETPSKPEAYLKGGNKKYILGAATFFLGFKNGDSKYKNPKAVIEVIFGSENKKIAQEIYDLITHLEQQQKRQVDIINPYSSLKLYEHFFQFTDEEQTQSDSEFEINFFKAYLIFNSQFTKRQSNAFTTVKDLDRELTFPMKVFCMSYIVSDKLNYSAKELWTTQFIKAIFLFKYLENDQRTKLLLETFLSHFNCVTWQNYLSRLLPLSFAAMKFDNETHTDIHVERGKTFEDDCSFIEKLIVLPDDKIDENDFLTLRAKPFFKIQDGVYRIIYNLFVIEKIYKGLYFILRELNDSMPTNQKLSNLRSIYCNEFSEKVLLYNVINLIYPEQSCIKISDADLKQMSSPPDFYLRKGKNIFLFESKDFLIPASVKESCDFEQYQDEFEKRLYFEVVQNKEKNGAILQIIENIKRVLKNCFSPDKDYKYREVSIYPILIVHDHQYNTSGFNYLINYWFQYELETLRDEGYYTNRIKPLVVINIDTLIQYHEGLQVERLDVIIDGYLKEIHLKKGFKYRSQRELEEIILSSLQPFSLFAENYFTQRGLNKSPELLMKFGLGIVEDNHAGAN